MLFFWGGDDTKTVEEKIAENLKTIEEWALQGMTEREIAKYLGIGYSSFRKIKGENLALLKNCATIKRKSKNAQVENVERSLYQRAMGYEYETKEFIKIKLWGYDENGRRWEKEDVLEKNKKIHVPADIQAARFFLINKNKREWQDNPHKIENDRKLLQIREKEVESKEW